MKLKPLLFVAGAAGAVAAVLKRRGGADAITQAASNVASAAPAPVKQAAQSAADTVQQAVSQATPGGGGEAGDAAQSPERYQPPIEAGAQPPAQPDGAPSDAPPVVDAPPVASEPGAFLNEPAHAPPEGAVVPDMSADDPLVRQQEAAARSDAGSIGGNVDELAAADASFPTDPAERPVVEGAGDENEETFEAREGVERGNRETES